MSAPPQLSDVDRLRDCQRVIYLDAEVPDCALDLGVAEQNLHGAEIACFSVDECGLGSPQGVRPENRRIKSDQQQPLIEEPGILPSAEMGATELAGEQVSICISGPGG